MDPKIKKSIYNKKYREKIKQLKEKPPEEEKENDEEDIKELKEIYKTKKEKKENILDIEKKEENFFFQILKNKAAETLITMSIPIIIKIIPKLLSLKKSEPIQEESMKLPNLTPTSLNF